MISLAAPIAKKLWPAAFLLVLVGLIAYAYAPSLKHVPRADQWAYTLDTLGSDGFSDIVAHTWSYSRTRKVGPGDTQLFRPLLFVVLAAEMALFGNHFLAWHLFGIALHVLVCVLLFSLLRRLRTLSAGTEAAPSALDWLPYLLALFFAVNFTVVDQVIWEHIIGYLLFMLLILAALRLLLEFSGDPATLRRPGLMLTAVWMLVALASFTYELGQFCAIAIGLYLAGVYLLQRRPRQALGLLAVFAGIVLLYQSANFFDRWYHRATYVDDLKAGQLLAGIPTTQTVNNLGRYVCFVLVQPFFPAHCPCSLLTLGKMFLEEHLWNHRLIWDAKALCCLTIFSLGILLTLLGLPRLRGGPLLYLLMTLAIVACHAALIVCGRLNLRPDPKALALNPYYIYVPLLLLLVCAAVPLLSLDRLRPASTALRNAVGALVVGLLILSIVNIDATRRINDRGAKMFQLTRSGNKAMLNFVKEHEGEPDFRLAIIRSPNDYRAFASTIEILYHRHLDREDRPTWFVIAQDGHPTFVPVARWRAEHPGEQPDLYPELVSVQPVYYVFRADDRYYAVPHIQFNPFMASSDRSTFPLVRRSLPELLALLREQPH